MGLCVLYKGQSPSVSDRQLLVPNCAVQSQSTASLCAVGLTCKSMWLCLKYIYSKCIYYMSVFKVYFFNNVHSVVLHTSIKVCRDKKKIQIPV